MALTFLWIASILMIIIDFDLFSSHINLHRVYYITTSLLLIPNTLLFIYAHHSLKENWNLPTEKSSILIKTKAYKLIRHPIYLTMLYLILYFIIISNNITIIICQIVIAAITINKMVKEEKHLEYKLDRYKDYMKKTKRLIPFLL